ncbi:MAG: sugar phosphate isomerase/epimerase, partial [Planctomycetes bacterium]|nr:sugar phosphate isomerase/epimerase [Planctomycetota bacterium]
MNDQERRNEQYLMSRRGLLGSAAAVAVGAMAPRDLLAGAKPNSVFNGVRIGAITYSYRGVETTAEGTLKAILDSGL